MRTSSSSTTRPSAELSASRLVIGVELQGHGHTPSTTGRPFTFDNSAQDVAALLHRLGTGPVDVLGFSNGGQVAMRLSIHHPELVRRQIVASAAYRRDGLADGFWDGLAHGSLASMPEVYREADRAINPDPAHQQQLFDLDSGLMLHGFTDWPDSDLEAIAVPTLVVPGGHGGCLGEVFDADGDLSAMHATVPWLRLFLDQDAADPPS